MEPNLLYHELSSRFCFHHDHGSRVISRIIFNFALLQEFVENTKYHRVTGHVTDVLTCSSDAALSSSATSISDILELLQTLYNFNEESERVDLSSADFVSKKITTKVNQQIEVS